MHDFLYNAGFFFLEHVVTLKNALFLLIPCSAFLVWKLWKKPKTVLFIVWNVFIVLTSLEFILLTPLLFPSVLPYIKPLAPMIRENYQERWRVLFGGPETMIYDPRVLFTLRPGSWDFTSTEFSTTINVNSQGLRDDESSLIDPTIIVLGDSYGMGWGTEQNETFAQVLEQSTKQKVLNAAITGYATPRQLRLLERLDKDNLTTLVVQYCDNDYLENKAFFESKNDVPTVTEKEWRDFWDMYLEQAGYYPYRLSLESLPKSVRDMKRSVQTSLNMIPKPPSVNPKLEAFFFLNALVNAGNFESDPLPENLRIVVFPMMHDRQRMKGFSEELSTLLSSSGATLPPAFRNIQVLDIEPIITDDDFFILDEHLSPAGHAHMATLISPLLATPVN
jgi:hypothetical protein